METDTTTETTGNLSTQGESGVDDRRLVRIRRDNYDYRRSESGWAHELICDVEYPDGEKRFRQTQGLFFTYDYETMQDLQDHLRKLVAFLNANA